jgi:hypothetical protein
MMRRVLLALAVVMVLFAGIGVYLAIRHISPQLPPPIGNGCEVSTASGVVHLEPEQMANAATIAAVGITRPLPDRAVLVALATALQESELFNLAGGDRDSVGLFQQRPSMGWGSADDIRDPRYAARAFYNQLVKVPGWEELRVTEAAQRVQRSAYPEAYERWVEEATVLSEALLGQAPGAVSCTRADRPAARGAAAATALADRLRYDWGDDVDTRAPSHAAGLAVPAPDARSGWQYAHWLVAHSSEQGVASVRFDGQVWAADSGKWTQVAANPDDAGHVVAEVYAG